MDSASRTRRDLVRGALERRLSEVRARQASRQPAPAGDGPTPLQAGAPGPADAEEILRIVMVRFWPRVRRGGSPEDWRSILDALARLEAPARGDDLRFLDAWNIVFEALSEIPDAAAPSGRASTFLAAYVAILEHHARRLQAAL